MYKISNKIMDYNSFYQCLDMLEKNKNNKYCVTKLPPIGKSKCGFSIEHYAVGNGPYHIVYMAGAHGNEIIGIHFILNLMQNLALGDDYFSNFNPHLFTIDFIPCQNPEGYFTTTYALQSVMKDMNEKERLAFCKQYYLNYRNENIRIKNINAIIHDCCHMHDCLAKEKGIVTSFWNYFHNKKFNLQDMCKFMSLFLSIKIPILEKEIESLWKKYLDISIFDNQIRSYLTPFQNIDLNCIPLYDEKHVSLRNALKKLYYNQEIPYSTLANFFANASGVNLNDNNPFYFQELNERILLEKTVYASPIYPLPKHVPSPFGTTSVDFNHFSYALENKAILQFLEKLGDSCYAFFNFHSTGGQLYIEPFYEKVFSTIPRDFSFYINNRIATEYLEEINKTYLEKTGVKSYYEVMGFPKKITGFADWLRSQYPAHFLIELSQAGGNPLGPFINPNYDLTLEAHIRACKKVMATILELEHLYQLTYSYDYTTEGKVNYYVHKRNKSYKKDDSK